jgi:hypothetical protein
MVTILLVILVVACTAGRLVYQARSAQGGLRK